MNGSSSIVVAVVAFASGLLVNEVTAAPAMKPPPPPAGIQCAFVEMPAETGIGVLPVGYRPLNATVDNRGVILIGCKL